MYACLYVGFVPELNLFVFVIQTEKIEAHRKFAILWHLLRDKMTQGSTTRKAVRSFDRYVGCC